jgi:hypothetical protein
VKNASVKARLVTAIVIAVILLGVLRTECYWQRLGGLVLPAMDLLIFAAFVMAVGKLATSIRFAIRNWSRHAFGVALPAALYLVTIVDAVANPLEIDCEALQSHVVERACYEGTMVEKTLRLRANGEFEWQSIGWFAISDFQRGAWRWDTDTLRLVFSRGPLPEAAQRYVRRGDTLLGVPGGGEQSYPPYFLEGRCRGEN